MDVPVAIGLWRCYSPICKKYEGLEYFLEDTGPLHVLPLTPLTDPSKNDINKEDNLIESSESKYNNKDADTEANLMGSSQSYSQSHIDIPPFQPIDYQSEYERETVREMLRQFQLPSEVAIASLAVASTTAALLAFYTIISNTCYNFNFTCCSFMSNMKVNCLVLLLSVFLMFAGMIAYILILLVWYGERNLVYGDAIWTVTITIFIGLACTLIAVMQEDEYESAERERLRQTRVAGYTSIATRSASGEVEFTYQNAYPHHYH